MTIPDSYPLRPFEAADLPAAHALSQAVRWPHRVEDWDLMLRLGRGHVATDATGAVRGVAMGWPQGEDFATLGMVIVDPGLQRAGLGRRLMAAVLEDLGTRRVQLVATAAGLRLYESLGFVTTHEIRQHNGVLAAGARPVAAGAGVRPLAAEHWGAVRALDARASGVDRGRLLAALGEVSTGYVAERGGALAGYALRRDFGRGRLVGPIVAEDETMALALLSTAVVDSGGFLRADIPVDAASLAAWLESAGLNQVGDGRVMRRGPAAPVGTGCRIFGLASQALG